MDENSHRWRNGILQKLHSRNQKQCDAFTALIQAHHKLFDSAESYRSKNVQLTVENERLRQEKEELQLGGDKGGGGGGNKSEKVQVLEQKVLRLHEELTELHRKKGENAQQIIDLNHTLQEKEKDCQAKDAKIYELESTMEGLREANRSLEDNLMEATTTNQVLTDEQQALQIAFASLEEKFRHLLEDNNDLVSRLMQLKSKAADKINAENDEVYQKKQQQMRKELAEAVKEPVKIEDPKNGDFASPVICMCVSIPEKALQSFDAHEGEVNAVKWSPSGRKFATGGSDRKLKLWEVVSGKCESKGILAGSNAAIMSVEFDLEERLVLAASNDFASRVWTLGDQRLRHTLTGHSGKVMAAKFLGDPNRVVTGSHDRTLKIWDLRSRACIKTIFAGSSCNDIVTSDGLGTNIISGHFDKKIRFWDTRSESSANEITLQGRVTSLDMAPDRASLLSCTRDDTLKLIDLRMNQVTRSFSAEGFRVGCDFTRAVFSPDGEYIMAGSSDGNLHIWNILKSSEVKVLKQHHHSIMACSWSPSGNSLLSCDKHRTVVLWSDF